jgi:hypothetical protein
VKKGGPWCSESIRGKEKKRKNSIQETQYNSQTYLCVRQEHTEISALLTAYNVLGFFDFSLLIWKMGNEKTANPLMFPL